MRRVPRRKAGRIGGRYQVKYRVSKANQSGQVIQLGEFDNLEAAKAAARQAVDRDHDASVHLGKKLVFGSNLTNDWKRRVESSSDGGDFSEQEIQSRNEAGW